VRLLFRDQAGLLLAPATDGPPGDPHHEALRAHLAGRGASFWPELVAAAQEANLDYDDATVLDALWDLVWAGELTNDTFAPLRALRWARPRPRRLRRRGGPCASASCGGSRTGSRRLRGGRGPS